MRIIGGKYKGRFFSPGKSFTVRPTTDFAKESLFNILTNIIDFETIRVLDLFAGTGSISFELLSRGVTNLTLVELNFKHVQFIKSIMKELNSNARVLRADAFKFIENEKTKYDLIFADPPYDHPRLSEIPDIILKKEILNMGGRFIIEHSKMYNFSQLSGFEELRKYGSVHFSFFVKK